MTKKEMKKEFDFVILNRLNEITEWINDEYYGIATDAIERVKGIIYIAESLHVINIEEWTTINRMLIELKGNVELMKFGIK